MKGPDDSSPPTPPGEMPRCEEADRGRESAEPRNVIALIRQLHSKQLTRKEISKEEILACVEHLTREGALAVEIAEMLSCSDRTIRRDLEAIRSRNAMEFDPSTGAQLLSEFKELYDHAIQRLRRAERDSSAKPSERVMALRALLTASERCAKLFQSLGYLPKVSETADSVPQQMKDLVARVRHLAGQQDACENAELAQQVRRVVEGMRDRGPRPPKKGESDDGEEA